MANKRITQLNEFTGNPASNDVFVFVQNSSLSTYKITYSNLLSSNNINVNSVYTTVRDNSAFWDEENALVAPIQSASGYWNTAYNNLVSNSANRDSAYTSTSNTSANWNAAYSVVNANSAILLITTGALSGNSLRTSFNAGSALGLGSFGSNSSTAHGNDSFAEGQSTNAFGMASHAEGYATSTFGMGSHAEGQGSIAGGGGSHAEGTNTKAWGDYSHAEGSSTVAGKNYSHSAGVYAEAAHERSWIWQGSTSTDIISTTRTDQFVVSAENGMFIPGNVSIGIDDNANALTVKGTISAQALNVDSVSTTVGAAANQYLSITVAGSAFKIPLYFES